MGARPEDYGLVLDQGSVHVDRYLVEVPEGRHRTHLTVGEGISEAFLLGELNLPYTESRRCLEWVDVVWRGQHQHDHVLLIVRQDHHRLCEHPARDVFCRRYLLGGYGPGVVLVLVGNPFLTQVSLEPFFARHPTSPPLCQLPAARHHAPYWPRSYVYHYRRTT